MSGRSKSKRNEGNKGGTEEKCANTEPLQDTFVFANGDKYVGQYTSRPDKSIQRHGNGQHILADGTVYEGLWEEDVLCGHGKIMYTSGAYYEGEVQGNQYSGRGTYHWPNGASMTAYFEKSRACGIIDYKDPEGRHWLGQLDGIQALNLRLRLE